jgi:hypothetical protein
MAKCNDYFLSISEVFISSCCPQCSPHDQIPLSDIYRNYRSDSRLDVVGRPSLTRLDSAIWGRMTIGYLFTNKTQVSYIQLLAQKHFNILVNSPYPGLLE